MMHDFSGFTPEFGYELTTDPIEVDDRTCFVGVCHEGKNMVVIAIGPDPEDRGDDSTLVRYTHIPVECVAEMLMAANGRGVVQKSVQK